MPAHNIALQIQIIACRIVLAGVAPEERRVISIGDKTDILAVPLPGGNQSLLFGDFPNLRFAECSQGEKNVCQLRLGETGQKISLILAVVFCFI